MGLFAKISAFMRTLLDDTSASAARTTLAAPGTAVANTFTAQNIFETGAAGASPMVFRQTGGTAGTDELQIAHTGTEGLVENKDGVLRFKQANSSFRFHREANSAVVVEVRNAANSATAISMQTGGGGEGQLWSSGWLAFGNSSQAPVGLNSVGLQLASGKKITFGTDANYHYAGTHDAAFSRAAANVIAIDDNATTGNPALALQARSSTTNSQDRFRWSSSAIDNTHASRKYAVTGSIYDTAARTVYYAWTDGSRGYFAVSAPNGTAPDGNQPNNTVCFYRNGSNELRAMYKNNSGTTTDINLGAVT